jgi:hypothetical protein
VDGDGAAELVAAFDLAEARLKTLFDSLKSHKGVAEVDEFLDLYNSLAAD